MLSYENSYKINLENSNLPLKEVTLARISISEDYVNTLDVFLETLLKQGKVLRKVKTIITPPDGVAAEFQWIDYEIYVPNTDLIREYDALGNLPALLTQAVLGTHAPIALIEIIRLDDEPTPAYFRKEIGNLSLIPFDESYSFTYTGVNEIIPKVNEGVLTLRAYSGKDWFVQQNFDANINRVSSTFRPSKSILFAFAMHEKGFWVSGDSIAEAIASSSNPLLDKANPTISAIMENIWKLNPSLQEEEDYQVYHRAIHAYKLAFGTVTNEILLSILSHPNAYKDLADYLITPPHPNEALLRTFIKETIEPQLVRYGTTSKTLTNEINGSK